MPSTACGNFTDKNQFEVTVIPLGDILSHGYTQSTVNSDINHFTFECSHCKHGHVLVIYSKQSILELTQEWFRELSLARDYKEIWSMDWCSTQDFVLQI